MSLNHLSEEAIQLYVFENKQDSFVLEHMSECMACRNKASVYSNLLEGFSNVKSEEFSFDASTLVMDKINVYENKIISRKSIINWVLLFISIIVLSTLAIPSIIKIIAFFRFDSVHTTLFIITTCVGILIYLLQDLNKQYRNKVAYLFEKNLQPNS